MEQYRVLSAEIAMIQEFETMIKEAIVSDEEEDVDD